MTWRNTGLSLLFFILFLIGFAVSPWGARAGLALAERLVPGLEIEYDSGSAFSSLYLHRLAYRDAAVKVDISPLALSWRPGCFLRARLCVDSLSVGAAAVRIQAQDPPGDTQVRAATPLSLPLSMVVTELAVKRADIALPGGALQLHALNLGADVSRGGHIALSPASLDLMSFTPAAPATQNTPATDKSAFAWPIDYPGLALPPLTLPVTLDAPYVQVKAIHLQQNTQTQQSTDIQQSTWLAFKHLGFGLSARQQAIALTALQLETPWGKLSGDTRLNTETYHVHSALALKHDSEGEGQLTLTGVPNQLQLNVTADSAFGKGELSAQLALLSPDLPLSVRGHWSEMKVPQAHLSDVSLSLDGSLASGKLSLAGDIRPGKGPEVKTRLQGQWDEQGISLDAQHQLLEGVVALEGRLAVNAPQALTLEAKVKLSEINPGAYWPDYAAKLNGEVPLIAQLDGDTWSLALSDINLDGQWRAQAFTLSGALKGKADKGMTDQSWADQEWIIDKLNIAAGDNRLLLSGTVDDSLSLSLALKANELGVLSPLFSGKARLDARVEGQRNAPRVSASGQGEGLSWPQGSAEAISLKGEVDLQAREGDILVDLSALTLPQGKLDTARLALSGNEAAHTLNLDARGEVLTAALTIEGSTANNQWQGQWREGEWALQGTHFRLDEAFALSADWHAQRYLVGAHCWLEISAEARLCLNADVKGTELVQAKVSLAHWRPAPVLSALLDAQFPGRQALSSDATLNVTASASGKLKDGLSARLDASLTPGEWQIHNDNTRAGVSLSDFQLNARLDPQTAHLVLALDADALGRVNTDLSIGLADKALSGKVDIHTLELSHITPFVPALEAISGRLASSLELKGQLMAPLVYGSTHIAHLQLQSPSLPVHLKQWQQTLNWQGQRVALDGDFLLGEGKGEIGGSIDWSQGLSGDITLVGQALEFDYQSQLRAQLSPNLRLQLAPQRIAVSGEVGVPYGRFKINELPEGGVSPSKDVILVDGPAPNTLTKQLHLDVKIKIDEAGQNQVKLDAMGLTSNLQGELRLVQDDKQQQAIGEINLIDGKYLAYGQHLLIRDGQVLFSGPLDRPYLSVEAIRDPELTADDVVAGIRVEGEATQPTLTLFSEPHLEQQEVLSYLLRGQGLSSGSSDSQDVLLTNLLLGISLGKSENLVGKVGRKLGVEDLALGTSGQGDSTKVNISGYIAPGVQLRYGVGVFDSAAEVALRYELMPKLFFEAVSGLDTALDLYYQFSLD